MFINGTAYAGKSTMVKMLADKYGLIECGENYDCTPDGIITPERYPNLGYFQTMKNWQEFYGRTPEDYDNWIQGNTQELIELEITYLMSISQSQKVIVDTNIPADVLREIADYNQIAVMLAPPYMSVEHFFNRDDDKPSMLRRMETFDNPEWYKANFRAILERINSQERYDEWLNSGFFTLIRKDTVTDTREETMETLAKHFGLTK
jgi:adenylate kinase family enzyme